MMAELKRLQSTLLIQVGNEAINFVKDNFRNQSFDTGEGGLAWAKRKKGAKRDDRPILVDTGKLKGGIRKTIQGNTVTISVAPPADEYAAVHNEGYEGTQRVTSRKGKTFSRKVKMPERRFIGDSKALDRRLRGVIDNGIRRIFN